MSEWQPISEEHLNSRGKPVGEWMLVWDEYSHTIHHARFSFLGRDSGWTAKASKNGQFPEIVKPTHVMPLPSPPEAS